MPRFNLRVFLTIPATLLLMSTGMTQTKKNDLVINFGVAGEGYGYPSGLTSTANSGIPTLNLFSEYSANKFFSLGIYGAYTYSYFEFKHPTVGYKDVWKGWDVGTKYTFHIIPLFKKYERADLYLTAFLGYTTRYLAYDKSNIYRDSLSYKVHALSAGGILGFRYLLTKSFGLYAEAGLSKKFFAGGGISFNINSKK